MISAGLFLETFYPQTLTKVDDGMGSFSEVWNDGTAFRGRLSSIYSGEKLQENKLTLVSSHKLFCNYQVISETSRIRNNDSTRYFNITGIINPSNSNHHLEIWLKEFE
jgi:head-tail adaptor